MKYYKNIKNKSKSICVWGCGYIGLSSLAYFAKNNVRAIGYDVNKKVVNDLKKGKIRNDDFKKWLGFSIKKLIKNNLKFRSYKKGKSRNTLCVHTDREKWITTK